MPALALVAGIATALSLSPLHLLPFAFGHAVLFLTVARAETARAAALRAWAWALGYHVVGLHWIANAMLVNAGEHAWLIPFANLGLPAFLALFAAAAGALAWRVFRRGVALWLGFAAVYALAEWARGHVLTGFPWNLPAATIDGWTPLLQPAALLGAYGLSLSVLVITMAPGLWFDPGAGRRSRIAASGVAAVLLAAMAGWGLLRMDAMPTVDAPGGAVPDVVIRVVQGNVPQRDKWNPLLKPGHLQRYLQLSDPTRQADMRGPGLAEGSRPTVTVWPETAVAQVMGNTPDLVRVLAAAAPPAGALLFGAPRVARVGPLVSVYNSFFATDPGGRSLWTYDKSHLVPFGEYGPLRGVLPIEPLVRSRRDFSRGPGLRTQQMSGAPPVSVLICYEAIFPGAVVDSEHRPAWLLNATNDAWFGEQSGPHQHLAVARLRTIEEGLPMVRAANTGISTVVDAAGRISVRLGIGETGAIDTRLPVSVPSTFYGKTGDLLFILIAMVLLAISVFLRFSVSRSKSWG